jgi:hypothetical protein
LTRGRGYPGASLLQPHYAGKDSQLSIHMVFYV